jgi:hypothetical protein
VGWKGIVEFNRFYKKRLTRTSFVLWRDFVRKKKELIYSLRSYEKEKKTKEKNEIFKSWKELLVLKLEENKKLKLIKEKMMKMGIDQNRKNMVRDVLTCWKDKMREKKETKGRKKSIFPLSKQKQSVALPQTNTRFQNREIQPKNEESVSTQITPSLEKKKNIFPLPYSSQQSPTLKNLILISDGIKLEEKEEENKKIEKKNLISLPSSSSSSPPSYSSLFKHQQMIEDNQRNKSFLLPSSEGKDNNIDKDEEKDKATSTMAASHATTQTSGSSSKLTKNKQKSKELLLSSSPPPSQPSLYNVLLEKILPQNSNFHDNLQQPKKKIKVAVSKMNVDMNIVKKRGDFEKKNPSDGSEGNRNNKHIENIKSQQQQQHPYFRKDGDRTSPQPPQIFPHSNQRIISHSLSPSPTFSKTKENILKQGASNFFISSSSSSVFSPVPSASYFRCTSPYQKNYTEIVCLFIFVFILIFFLVLFLFYLFYFFFLLHFLAIGSFITCIFVFF